LEEGLQADESRTEIKCLDFGQDFCPINDRITKYL